MTQKYEKIPDCFGDLKTVFPKGENGLRNSPESCLECSHKTACLRSAIESDKGLKVREEHIDRAYTSGTLSFLERWSQKKVLHRRLKEKEKGRQKRRG